MIKTEREYKKEAKQGDARTQYNLGLMYANGENDVPQNDKKAVKWYRKAAKRGDADAQNNLGWMYENGKGVRKSDVNACMWYKRAIKQGQTRAGTNYNKLVPKMTSKAEEWAEAKAEEKKMAYIKQRIKPFLKKVFGAVIGVVILVILCVSVIPWLFPEALLARRILDVRDDALDNIFPWWSDQQGPPQIKLEEEDFTWLSEPLYGKETDTLYISIKNYGDYARNMTIELSSSLQGLKVPRSTAVRNIPKGGVETVNILISGDINLPDTIDASIDFRLNEPKYGLKYEKRLFFETRKFRNPQLKLANYGFLETTKETSDDQIDLNDEIALKFYVQNIGCSEAKDVEIKLVNKQRDLMDLTSSKMRYCQMLWMGVSASLRIKQPICVHHRQISPRQ